MASIYEDIAEVVEQTLELDSAMNRGHDERKESIRYDNMDK